MLLFWVWVFSLIAGSAGANTTASLSVGSDGSVIPYAPPRRSFVREHTRVEHAEERAGERPSSRKQEKAPKISDQFLHDSIEDPSAMAGLAKTVQEKAAKISNEFQPDIIEDPAATSGFAAKISNQVTSTAGLVRAMEFEPATHNLLVAAGEDPAAMAGFAKTVQEKAAKISNEFQPDIIEDPAATSGFAAKISNQVQHNNMEDSAAMPGFAQSTQETVTEISDQFPHDSIEDPAAMAGFAQTLQETAAETRFVLVTGVTCKKTIGVVQDNWGDIGAAHTKCRKDKTCGGIAWQAPKYQADINAKKQEIMLCDDSGVEKVGNGFFVLYKANGCALRPLRRK